MITCPDCDIVKKGNNYELVCPTFTLDEEVLSPNFLAFLLLRESPFLRKVFAKRFYGT